MRRRSDSFFKQHKNSVVLALAVVTANVMLMVNTNPLGFRPKETGLAVFSGIQSVFSGVGNWFSETVNSINEMKDLKAQYDATRQKLLDYESMTTNTDELKSENASLREQLGYSQKLEFEHINAEILGHDPGPYVESYLLNKGAKDMVARGMPVIAHQNGMYGVVGKVMSVGWATCLVSPVFSPSFSVHSRMQASRIEGIVSGSPGQSGLLLMTDVNKHSRNEIISGDMVVTSGSTYSMFPKGLAVGRVQEIAGKEYNNTLDIVLYPVIEFNKLEYVFILKTQERP